MITWTIGAGGLLGSAVQRITPDNFQATPIPWNNLDHSVRALQENFNQFREQARNNNWAIIWAAGNATTSTPQEQTAVELESFTAVTHALANNPPAGNGAFFVSSSAGGVYAGSENPPFDDQTQPRPLSPYGELKLAQEHEAKVSLSNTCPVVIGRISNLYGPGQNLNKLQGLISRLALAAITKQPINMFVSLDTMRDYIYSTDAAAVVNYWVADAVKSQPQHNEVKLIASGIPVSLGSLIHLMQDIARTKIPIAFGAHASASAQALDLRLSPSENARTERLVQTTLASGVKNVYLDILERFQQGSTAL